MGRQGKVPFENRKDLLDCDSWMSDCHRRDSDPASCEIDGYCVSTAKWPIPGKDPWPDPQRERRTIRYVQQVSPLERSTTTTKNGISQLGIKGPVNRAVMVMNELTVKVGRVHGHGRPVTGERLQTRL